MTTTADEMSLKNKHLSNSDYFAIIAFRSNSILLTNYAKNGLVGALCNSIWRMKSFLLGVHVIVKTVNLEIFTLLQSVRLLQRILLKCVLHAQHDYFFLIYPIR